MADTKLYLFPLSLLYGAGIRIRNFAYKVGICKEKSFDNVVVIGVGNLSVGGTGKTPMVEYLVEHFSDKYKTAILSRGYGRKTKGFRVCKATDTYKEIGDEPLQYVCKYPNVHVTVHENRVHGINNILKHFPDTQLIILDDSYQHRRVKPALNILMTNYYHPYNNDFLLPAGMLREHISNSNRADIIVVTNCDKVMSPILARDLRNSLKVTENQDLLFSHINYSDILPVPNSLAESSPQVIDKKYCTAIVFSGVAQNYPFVHKAKNLFNDIDVLEFKDHYEYTVNDLKKIKKMYDDNYGNKKFILTTEKDMRRLQTPELQPIIKTMQLYYLPIKPEFSFDGDKIIEKRIDELIAKL